MRNAFLLSYRLRQMRVSSDTISRCKQCPNFVFFLWTKKCTHSILCGSFFLLSQQCQYATGSCCSDYKLTLWGFPPLLRNSSNFPQTKLVLNCLPELQGEKYIGVLIYHQDWLDLIIETSRYHRMVTYRRVEGTSWLLDTVIELPGAPWSSKPTAVFPIKDANLWSQRNQ